MNYPLPYPQTILFSQHQLLMEIEQLVEYIIATYQPIPLIPHSTDQHIGFHEPFYLQVLEELLRLLSVYTPVHDYYGPIRIFWQACRDQGFLNICTEASQKRYPSKKMTIERVSVLVGLIFKYAKSPQFTRQVSDRLYEIKQKEEHLRAYATALHAHYARLLVVRVDFCYHPATQHLVTIDDVYRHLDTFMAMKSRNDIFEHEVGYAWVVEEGVTKGYHIHAAFYFLGSKHQNDWFMAQQIGALWNSITGDLGYFFNCSGSSRKAKFEQQGTLGIGMIHRDDPIACNNAIETIAYLADPEKEGQYLRMKPEGRRMFRMGHSPKVKP
jgi:hypothetical protein